MTYHISSLFLNNLFSLPEKNNYDPFDMTLGLLIVLIKKRGKFSESLDCHYHKSLPLVL